jgi:hypothetical protein
MRRRAARNRGEHNVVNGAIHRLIELQAASQPETMAVNDGTQCLTYRELNQRANTLARRLSESGLTRGAVAIVRMDRGADLATVLLAVLKAGAAYRWVEPGSADDLDLPSSFCIAPRRGGGDQAHLAIDLRGALADCRLRPSPNLPILTRGSDIACVLRDHDGQPHVFVPHATITALPASARNGEWTAEPGAFDLWLGLMSGATVSLALPTVVPAPAPSTSAAA